MKYVWCIVRPGYGDFEGLPVQIWTTARGARDQAKHLNAPWEGTLIRPFKVKRMEVCE